MSVDELHRQGNFLKARRRYAEAVPPLQEAARLAPRQAAIWLNLGVALLELGRLQEAVAAFECAVTLESDRPEARNILGHALLCRGELARAEEMLERALQLRPGYAAALENLGRVQKAQGRAAEALERHRQAGKGSNFLYTLNLVAGVSPEEISNEHKHWGAKYAEVEATLLHQASDGRLSRIGYVSPDFCHHAVAYFLEPVLQRHDRSRFEIFCYSDVRVPDAVTERLKSHVEHWRDIAGRDDAQVGAQIRADGIDLLIDLAGHTANHRLGVFAGRAAPVQATWLGYPNTTGLAAMDFRITDAIADPPGVTDRWHTEQLIRLSGPFSCYRPPADAPAVQDPPSAARGWITFGCFNHLAKITPPVVAAWSRILDRVRGSELLLKTRGLDEATRRNVRERFAAHGIDPVRIEINAESLSVRDHLALYGGVDIALDAFPYNGATTTCEALWMGVPVVALAGKTHVSRVGASLLTHAGLSEWIAGDIDAYVDRAATLAADAGALAEVRRDLRGRVAGSAICDERRFTGAFEEALGQMTGLPAKVAQGQAVRSVV